MKWIILVYLTIAAGTTDRGRESKTKYVRSLYWEYKNTLGDIKAECVFANSPLPYSKRFTKQKK
jgi:hypothetical protein